MSEGAFVMVFMLVTAVLYFGQAALAGYLATRRGHVFWLWFLVPLLIVFPLGFITTFIYAKKDDHTIP